MIKVLQHSLVQRDLSILRDKNTPSDLFRTALARIGNILAVEATRSLALSSFPLETPLESTIGFALSENIVLLPILRSGLAFVEPFLAVIPDAMVGYIGLKRNEETLVAEEYYYKVPPINARTTVILLDPMLATGGSMTSAIERITLDGAGKCIAVTLVSAPEGIQAVHTKFPDVPIITAALDRELNTIGYILPGLGDAGDRINGTI